MTEIRKLRKTDYHFGFFELLSQLTNVKKPLYNEFSKQYDIMKSQIFVIEFKNEIIATGSIFIEPKFIRNMKNVGHIEDIVVSKDHRGLGLGKMIMQKLINCGKSHDCYKIILNCSDKNVGFYKKYGFEIKELEMAMYF